MDYKKIAIAMAQITFECEGVAPYVLECEHEKYGLTAEEAEELNRIVAEDIND